MHAGIEIPTSITDVALTGVMELVWKMMEYKKRVKILICVRKVSPWGPACRRISETLKNVIALLMLEIFIVQAEVRVEEKKCVVIR